MLQIEELTLQYVTNDAGQRSAVIIPIEQFDALLKDLADLSALAERRDEATNSHKQLKLDLLDDDALWEIARSQLSAGDVTRLTWLLEENADNALMASERAELAARAAEAERFSQRKARAAALLQQRGYVVPSGDDL